MIATQAGAQMPMGGRGVLIATLSHAASAVIGIDCAPASYSGLGRRSGTPADTAGNGMTHRQGKERPLVP